VGVPELPAGGGLMQTFLPHEDFAASARALDTKRLGKQRVESLQILNALTVPGYGWGNHPATLMWRGYEEALVRYTLEVCRVWCERGFGDTCAVKVTDALAERLGVTEVRTQAELAAAGELPPWLGDDALHRSHRSSLVAKDPEHYGPQFPDADADLPYRWPVRSPAAVAAEEAKARRAVERAERAVRRAEEEAAKLAARRAKVRSRAAKKAAATRKRNAAVARRALGGATLSQPAGEAGPLAR
jgi:hypothetical protein